MRFTALFAVLLLMALAACTSLAREQAVLPPGVQKIKDVKARRDGATIAFSQYRLSNGLTVVLHEDASDPMVHVDVTYHVGSAREEIGRSGFAHFFEHMMFQGSANVADEQHFGLITASGGTLNGTTNSDRTNYFETVPSNQLEKMLWLEADRMGFLLSAVTGTKFENQRETVKNERGQNYDNRPYGLVREKIAEALYPEGHPYSWLTIGYIEDLNRADLADLKDFFLRWYGPNNATLTIGGNIDEAQTLAWIARYFGPIPRGPEVLDAGPVPVTLPSDRYVSYEDNVTLPYLQMAWPTVHLYHADEAPLDVLQNIIGVGRTSLLYKSLLKSNKAVSVQASHNCQELACTFALSALPNPGSGTSLAAIETEFRAALRAFETRGVEDDDLARVKAQIIADKIYALESVSGKASQLAFYQTFAEDADYGRRDVQRYRDVTKADVVRVYERYLKGRPAVILSVVPKGKRAEAARADNWMRPARKLPEPARARLPDRVPADTFDRSVLPPAGAAPELKMPQTWTAKTPNGIAVLGARNAETPTAAVQIRVEAGQRHETLATLGIAGLTAEMLDEATQFSSSEDLSNRLDKMGSFITISADDRYVTMTVRSLSKNLCPTLEIAAEKLLAPKFAASDFERVKAQTIESIRQRTTDASRLADMAFSLVTAGREDPAAWPDQGMTHTVSALTVGAAREYYRRQFTAGNAHVLAVSDLDEAKTLTCLKAFFNWQGVATQAPSAGAAPQLDTGALYFIDKPGAAQSELRIGRTGPRFDATGPFYRSVLANYPFGGAFNSRLNLNLREGKGYTYGIRSNVLGDDRSGSFVVSTGVRTDATANALKEIFKELGGYRQGGASAGEVDFMRSAIGQTDARRYETPVQKLGLIAQMQDHNLSSSFIDERRALVNTIAKEELVSLARGFDLSDMIVVVVGDRAKVFSEIGSLGRRVIELDTEGRPLAPRGASS